jgi:hypothetical protein
MVAWLTPGTLKTHRADEKFSTEQSSARFVPNAIIGQPLTTSITIQFITAMPAYGPIGHGPAPRNSCLPKVEPNPNAFGRNSPFANTARVGTMLTFRFGVRALARRALKLSYQSRFAHIPLAKARTPNLRVPRRSSKRRPILHKPMCKQPRFGVRALARSALINPNTTGFLIDSRAKARTPNPAIPQSATLEIRPHRANPHVKKHNPRLVPAAPLRIFASGTEGP